MHDGCMTDVVNGVMRPEAAVVVGLTVVRSTLILVMDDDAGTAAAPVP